MTSPLPTAALWPAISRLLDDVLALAPADRAPWLDRLATLNPVHHLTLRELLATLERVEEDDFLGGTPLISMLHRSMIRLELLHCTINRRPP
ncbi:MAG: hypothetical protein H7276_15225 [Caulobacter sp.]|nr:hypothetical protein [Vitreoscilla sp.]